MKGNITTIRRIIDEYEVIRGYEIIIETAEEPRLRLGECNINQNGTK